MQHKLPVFAFGLVLLTVTIYTNGQQKIGDDKLLAWGYRWRL